MEFRTKVAIEKMPWQIEPESSILLVGSCFADEIGRRFTDNQFRATVNPFGVMYNPASILHTVERTDDVADVAFLTLGTNHVYRLKETGEIVDNCQKRPQKLFTEEELTVEECASYLRQTAQLLTARNPEVRMVLTVSPIRYAKYGFHGSSLSKATLLLAAHALASEGHGNIFYFPAYELMNDELRDYRFYAPDMIHPSEQAVDYIWQQLIEACFGHRAKQMMAEWLPIRQALSHKPFHPDSEEYRRFALQTQQRLADFRAKYHRG